LNLSHAAPDEGHRIYFEGRTINLSGVCAAQKVEVTYCLRARRAGRPAHFLP
jgi:hypothetical protein